MFTRNTVLTILRILSFTSLTVLAQQPYGFTDTANLGISISAQLQEDLTTTHITVRVPPNPAGVITYVALGTGQVMAGSDMMILYPTLSSGFMLSRKTTLSRHSLDNLETNGDSQILPETCQVLPEGGWTCTFARLFGESLNSRVSLESLDWIWAAGVGNQYLEGNPDGTVPYHGDWRGTVNAVLAAPPTPATENLPPPEDDGQEQPLEVEEPNLTTTIVELEAATSTAPVSNPVFIPTFLPNVASPTATAVLGRSSATRASVNEFEKAGMVALMTMMMLVTLV
jgi:hypothetical protein